MRYRWGIFADDFEDKGVTSFAALFTLIKRNFEGAFSNAPLVVLVLEKNHTSGVLFGQSSKGRRQAL